MKLFKVILLIFIVTPIFCQDTLTQKIPFFQPSEKYNQSRFIYASAFGGVSYLSFSYGLYNSWYKGFDKTNFHLFNDWGEWKNMDKAGHVFSGYFQSHLTYQGAKWTGLDEHKCVNIGVITGMLFQTTIEVMDGFNEEWGFSIPDISANILGLSVFYSQQKIWKEQRITLKESSWPAEYNNGIIYSTNQLATTSEKERAEKLFGTSWGEKVLKDYNVQTYWASVNMKSFLGEESSWPGWLNLAVGYGAGNLYGGFENKWQDANGNEFDLSNKKRYHQYYLALDYDLRKIKPKNHFLSTVLNVLDLYKFPAPAIEYNTIDGFKLHLMLGIGI